MRFSRVFPLVATALLSFACAPTPQAQPAEVELNPSSTTSTPRPSAEPTASAVASAEPAAEGSCPLFCTRASGTCTRPQITEKNLMSITCGQFSMGAFEKLPREACPDTCCPAATGSGADADADGLLSSVDRCENEPEDRDGFQDQDGCPELDNDRDGLDDIKDKCCYVAEDMDGKEDLDGCPEG
ncbi:MAG: hypothetical protein HOW73_05530 [Polyangiaceae bacterium]|nr:hypothetical protein [Polyangiaceae bacterium]